MTYKFTADEKERAHNTDLVDFLEKRGEEIKHSGTNNYWMHDGETISLKGNLWFNHYTQRGGEAIGFVREFFGLPYAEAVGFLLGYSQADMKAREYEKKPQEPFRLPERNDNSKTVIRYLTRDRGIDKEIVSTFIKHNLIYEDKKHHNAVFVGYDRKGIPKHAHMRGSGSQSTFKMTTPRSSPEYSFHWTGKDDELFLFEAPIDMLSYISMFQQDWKQHTYAAACSVTDRVLFKLLEENPDIKTVHICFDNDTAGQKAAERIIGKLSRYDVTADVIKPDFKDWNEDLTTPDGMKPIGREMMID